MVVGLYPVKIRGVQNGFLKFGSVFEIIVVFGSDSSWVRFRYKTSVSVRNWRGSVSFFLYFLLGTALLCNNSQLVNYFL